MIKEEERTDERLKRRRGQQRSVRLLVHSVGTLLEITLITDPFSLQ